VLVSERHATTVIQPTTMHARTLSLLDLVLAVSALLILLLVNLVILQMSYNAEILQTTTVYFVAPQNALMQEVL